MTWIKCSDKLPEYNHKVLVVDENGDMAVGIRCKPNSWWPEDYWWEIYSQRSIIYDITHWMELPEKP